MYNCNILYIQSLFYIACMSMTCDEGLIAAPDLALLVAVR